MRNKRTDLVHCNQVWNNPLAVIVGEKLDVPVICHMRDYTTSAGLHWFLARPPHAVITVSRHLEGYVRSQGLPSRIPVTTLVGPVIVPPYEVLKQREERRRRLYKLLNISRKTRLLVFAGQLIHQKGITILCEALEKLGNRQVRLICIGATPHQWQRLGEPWRRKLLSLVECGLVMLMPSVSDISHFYLCADLVVLPSLEEPLGRVVLEAASFGVPSIVADADGLAETVIPHVTGWQIRVGDADALAEAIKSAMELPLSEYGWRARNFVERNFSCEIYAKRLMEFYKTVMNSGGNHK